MFYQEGIKLVLIQWFIIIQSLSFRLCNISQTSVLLLVTHVQAFQVYSGEQFIYCSARSLNKNDTLLITFNAILWNSHMSLGVRKGLTSVLCYYGHWDNKSLSIMNPNMSQPQHLLLSVHDPWSLHWSFLVFIAETHRSPPHSYASCAWLDAGKKINRDYMKVELSYDFCDPQALSGHFLH